jgi:hypothetical protein
VKKELCHWLMGVNVDMVDSGGTEGARSPDEAVDLIPLSQQQFCQIGAVLAGDSSDEGFLHQFPFMVVLSSIATRFAGRSLGSTHPAAALQDIDSLEKNPHRANDGAVKIRTGGLQVCAGQFAVSILYMW